MHARVSRLRGGQGRGLKPQEYLVVITLGVGRWTTLQEGKGMKIEMLVEYASPLAISKSLHTHLFIRKAGLVTVSTWRRGGIPFHLVIPL